MGSKHIAISRWALGLEWLACFGSLTLLWGWSAAFIATRDNVPLDIFIAAATGTTGPAALVLAFIATCSNSYKRYAKLFGILAISFAVFATAQLLDVGAHAQPRLQWFEFDVGVFVLCAVLPLLACLHLLVLGRSDEEFAA